jgi:MOSC domain-containing protein YiiM
MRPPQPAAAHLLSGRARPFGPNGEPSAIDKHCVAAPLRLTAAGLAGDEQADRRHHGGVDKALHHYPAEHYAYWRDASPQVDPARFRVGGFGENVSTLGLAERNVCTGDVFRLGGALIQVSQARQPCWKLDVRFGVANLARRVQDSARTGWYYRVLAAGVVAPGDALALVDRPHPEWPLARLLHHLYADPLNAEALRAIAALAALSPGWRQLAEHRLHTGRIEDWTRRLTTPATGARERPPVPP